MIKCLWNWILDLLYPRKCILCTKILSRNETDLCTQCRMSTERVPHAVSRGKHFGYCYSVFYYKNDVASAVKKLKFSGKQLYADAFGRLLAMKLLEEKVSADLITWVPVSKKRKRKRGYDQAEEIAKAVGKEFQIPVKSLLQKVRHNSAQARISDHKERRTNVLNAYKATDPSSTCGRRILLIDDVITSGATLDECSKILSQAGAESVVCGTFAATSN